MLRSVQVTGALVAVLVGLAYGSSLVFARLSYDHGTSYFTIVALRYLLLTGALALVLRTRGIGVYMPQALAVRASLIGLLSVVTSVAYLASVAFIPVSLGTLIFYTHPLLTVVLAALVSRIRTSKAEWLATVVAFVGLGVVLEVSFEALHPLGIALGLVASVAAAAIFVLSAPVIARVGSMRFTFYVALSGAACGCLLAAAVQSMAFPESPTGWLLLAATVLLNVVGLLGMFIAVRLLGPVATPMVLNLEPVTAIALAVLVIGEQLSALQAGGAVLVIGAILAAQMSRAVHGRPKAD